MFFVFVFYWAIAIFILSNKNKNDCDRWSAFTFLLFGLAGLSVVLRAQTDLGRLSWVVPATVASIGMLWAPYTLLIASLHHCGKISKSKTRQFIINLLIAIPLIGFYFIVPVPTFFGFIEPMPVSNLHTKIMTMTVAPYYLLTAIFLTMNLFHKVDQKKRKENLATFIIVVPTTFSYFIVGYVLPALGELNSWRMGAFLLGI